MVSAAMLVDLIGPWSNGADPLNEQLAEALAQAIEAGLLPPGTRLPAERELARELALSRTTIVAAYDRLRLAGLARSRQGSGHDGRPTQGELSRQLTLGGESGARWQQAGLDRAGDGVGQLLVERVGADGPRAEQLDQSTRRDSTVPFQST